LKIFRLRKQGEGIRFAFVFFGYRDLFHSFFDAISEICGAKIGAKQQKINRSAENVALLRAI
jgi:hypothetical protein